MDNKRLDSLQNDIQILKNYRDSVEFYRTNKEAFEKPENSIQLDDNIAYFYPLNDMENHLQEDNLKKLLATNDRGAIGIIYIVIGMIIIIGIVIAIILKGV